MSSPVQNPKSFMIHHEQSTYENDGIFGGTSDQEETLNRKPDPPQDPEKNEGNDNQDFQDDEGIEEETEEEIGAQGVKVSSGMNDDVQMPITERDVSATTALPVIYTRRKKGKGKGKGKTTAKKVLAAMERIRSLNSGLNPIPFLPHKLFDFPKHERLLRKLGLWDFVQIDFDRNIRVDLIAQLVATYEPKSRGSYVNGFRIMVNRTDLGRALKLLVKKEKGNVGGVGELDLEWGVSSEEYLGLIESFLLDWMILHEDPWAMPWEVLNWLNLIKDGHPEKVDWASVIWFMVEKELTLGGELKNCYYAPHLQLLIKSQREELFHVKNYASEALDLDLESKEEDEDDEEEEEKHEEIKDSGVNCVDVNEEGKQEEGVNGLGDINEEGKQEEGVNDLGDVNEEGKQEEGVIDLGNVNEEGKQNYGVNDVGDVNEEGEQEEGLNGEGDVKGKHMDLCALDLTFGSREDVLLRNDHTPEAVELYVESREEEEDDEEEKQEETENVGANDADVNDEGKLDKLVDDGHTEQGKQENCLIGGPSTKLTLGQDGEEEEEEMKEMEIMYSEKCKENDEELSEEYQGQWLLHGKNDLGDHFMQRCDNDGPFGSFEIVKEENDDEDDEEEDVEQQEDEDEEDVGDEPVHVFPDDDSLEGNGLMGNLLQTIEGNQIAFGSQEQLHHSSSMEMQHMGHTPSFSNHLGKRAIDHDNDIPHHELNGSSNKRIRINDPWDNKPIDFGTCMGQIQQMTEKAMMMYEQREQVIHETSMNNRILLSEVEKRDGVIDQLHKMRIEEIQKKDMEIYRLTRELGLMENVIDGYRKALKETQKAFDEYRERFPLKEEPAYRDAWPGGLMLSNAEIETFKKDLEMQCLILETNVKEAETFLVDKLNFWDSKLNGLEAEAKELVELNMKKKNKAEKLSEVDKDQPTLQIKEEATEVGEQLPSSGTEEAVCQEKEETPTAQAKGELLEAPESLTNE